MSQHHGEALEEFLRMRRINKGDAADKLGISRGTLYLWFNKKELPDDSVLLLKERLGFDPFIKSNGYANKTSVHVVNEPEVKYNTQMSDVPRFKPNIIYVPLYAFGGFMTGYRDTIFIDSLEHFSLPGVTGEHYAFEIAGMSMYKAGDELSASPGDIAISRPIESFSYLMKGKGYVLQTVEGILYKIFDKLDEKAGYFHSLNSEYEHQKIPLKEIKRLYFVNFILKKTK